MRDYRKDRKYTYFLNSAGNTTERRHSYENSFLAKILYHKKKFQGHEIQAISELHH